MKVKKKNKTIINIIIIFIIIGLIIYLSLELYKENKIKDNGPLPYDVQTISLPKKQEEQNQTNTQITESLIEYPKEEIIKEYKGYDVSAKLTIPKINLETYILQNYSEQALKISVTKFWGVNANEIGNFCVAGHNFKNKNMFHNLKELEIGDNIQISDNNIGIVRYEIYDIYKVEPEDVNCLSQDTNNKREVTLITCTTDSKKRIIVKARETI